MPRRLATAGLVALLALLTLSVVWAGLNWPPPLWIVEEGWPEPPAPTGRIARVQDVEFHEVSPGYFFLGDRESGAGESFAERLLTALRIGPRRPAEPERMWIRMSRLWISREFRWSGALGERVARGFLKRNMEAGQSLARTTHLPRATRARLESEWKLARQSLRRAWCEAMLRASGLPVRIASTEEWWWTLPLEESRKEDVRGIQSLEPRFPPERLPDLLVRASFSLTPDQEHLVEPYLVEGE